MIANAKMDRAFDGPLLEVAGVKTWFQPGRGWFHPRTAPIRAVDGVDFVIREGETLGLVGESGCGKSTLARTILGIEQATAGRVRFRGRDLTGLTSSQWRPFRRQLQMVFQDPYASLNPRWMVCDIVTEGLWEHGLLEGMKEDAAVGLLREVGLDDDALYRYPFEFSGGQRQRIAIARVLALSPALLICDEAVSALDVSVRAQVLNLLRHLRERRGLSYLFIAHDLAVVHAVADRVAVMYLGRIVESGPADAVLNRPLHPYTAALCDAVPRAGARRIRPRTRLAGDPPSPATPPAGCPFHPRCPRRLAVCGRVPPPDVAVGPVRVRCHLHVRQA